MTDDVLRRVLNEIEKREMPLLTWGVTNGATVSALTLEYACEDSSAGAEVQVLSKHLTIKGTGSWSQFSTLSLGEVELVAALVIDDEVGTGHVLRQQRIELLVDEQLGVVEVEEGEELALLEHVVGEGVALEEGALGELLLLAIAREEEEELDLEGGARTPLVEGSEERVLPPLLHHRSRLHALGQALHHRRLAHADRPFDDDVVGGHQRATTRPGRTSPVTLKTASVPVIQRSRPETRRRTSPPRCFRFSMT